MFMGEFHPALDEKGRVAIPARLRKAFGDQWLLTGLVLTHGFDRCIMAFREDDWRSFVEERLKPMEQSDPEHRRKVRFLLGGASFSELDRQGRVHIPSHLKEYAGLVSDVTVLGLYNRIELWNRQHYAEYKPEGDELNEFATALGI